MATRIGIIGDTHIPGSIPELWPEVRTVFEGVDLILHAGDLETPRVLDWLEKIAPVLAAEGNHDRGLSQYDHRIKPKHFLDIEGYRVGMTHIIDGWNWGAERIVRTYLGEKPDIVVCGDTHFEFVKREDGMLIVNPGSATYPHNMEARRGHVALLEVERDSPPNAWIVDLSELSDVPNDRADPHRRWLTNSGGRDGQGDQPSTQ